MQEYSTSQPVPNPPQGSSTGRDVVSVNGAIALIVLLIPITFYIGINTYKKYRAVVFRQQIATLEKVWHLDNKKKKA